MWQQSQKEQRKPATKKNNSNEIQTILGEKCEVENIKTKTLCLQNELGSRHLSTLSED